MIKIEMDKLGIRNDKIYLKVTLKC
jgi:hypothetical protein